MACTRFEGPGIGTVPFYVGVTDLEGVLDINLMIVAQGNNGYHPRIISGGVFAPHPSIFHREA